MTVTMGQVDRLCVCGGWGVRTLRCQLWVCDESVRDMWATGCGQCRGCRDGDDDDRDMGATVRWMVCVCVCAMGAMGAVSGDGCAVRYDR